MSAWLALFLAATFVAVVVSVCALAAAWSRPVPDAVHAPLDGLSWRWRLAWPVLVRLAPLARPLIGAAQRERLRERLARAGLEGALTAERFVAGQGAAALVAGALAVSVFAALDASSFWAVLVAGALGASMPRVALDARAARRRHAILRQLPHDLDLVTLSVDAGLNLGSALAHAAANGPPGALRDEWQRVLRDVRAGQARHEALRAMSTRVGLPAVSNVVAALIAAERQGASLAPILRAQAEQRRTERFLRAERLAMEAPVKMLLPLVLFIFPGTFAILLFPIVYRLLTEGIL